MIRNKVRWGRKVVTIEVRCYGGIEFLTVRRGELQPYKVVFRTFAELAKKRK